MTENNKTILNITEKKPKPICGCGRSPNGKCIGWHQLSFEEYEYRKEMYETGKCDLYGNDLK